MTKIHSALVLAVATTVALSSTRIEALSLLPWQQRQQRRARVSPTDVHSPSPSASSGIRNHGLFGKKRSRRSSSSSTALQWMLPHQVTSLSSPFLSRLPSTKEKEDVSAAYDDADDEKSWPIKPVVPHPPPLPPSLVDQLSPLLDPTIAKNVPADTIQGAALNGAVLTLLTSVWLFGPLSAVGLGTLVAAASVGILAAYVSITEGFAGDLVRGVGSVTKNVADTILTGVEGWQAEQEVGKVANSLMETPLPRKVELTPRPPPPAAAVDVAVDYDAAARLAYDAAGSDGEFGAFRAAYRAETSGMVAQKWLDAFAAEAATARAAEDKRVEAAAAAAAEKAAAEATAAAERKAVAEEMAAVEAKAAAEKQAAAEATAAAERKAAVEAKAAAEEQAAVEATAAAERKAAVEAKAAAEEKATAAAAERKRNEEEEEAAAARASAEEEATARAKATVEEEARAQAAAEQARLEERARALEEARLAEAEERRVVEEQAAAAREAVRLMEEQAAQEEEDEQEEPGTIDDEDWEAAVRFADELQEGAAVGGDVMGALNDDMLRAEINDLSAEEEDALGKAAREAVRKYEEELARAGASGTRAAPAPAEAGEPNGGVEEAAPAPPLTADYSKMTVVQLKSELRSKGLKMSGKKAELIERLETS